MSVLFTNNAVSTLASGISAVATSLTVQAADGLLFPNPTGSDFFLITLQDASNNIEIIKVTSKASDTFTVVRAQEGTSALVWLAADSVELRITAGILAQYRQGVGDEVTDSAISLAVGAADVHDIINLTNAVTLTLADAATMAAGYQITIKNSSTADCTIARATGGDSIDGVVSNVVLAPKAVIYLSVNSAENGYITMYRHAPAAYPVGAIFLTTSSVSPAISLGFGWWTQIAQGRMLIGEGTGSGLTNRTAGAEIGQEDAIIPIHGHDVTDPGHIHNIEAANDFNTPTARVGHFINNQLADIQTKSAVTGITVDTATGGEAVTDKNLPPYIKLAYIQRIT